MNVIENIDEVINTSRYEGLIKGLAKKASYYVVHVEGRGMPTKKHLTYNEAFEEALRLSNRESSKVTILQAITEIDRLPFITQL